MAFACLALGVALGGTSYAAVKIPPDSVGQSAIREGAVGTAQIRNGSTWPRPMPVVDHRSVTERERRRISRMEQLTDGRQTGILPGWRYWIGALFLLPVALAVPAGLIFFGTAHAPWAWVAMIVVAGLGVAGFLHERRIRIMPAGRRAAWVALGLALGAAAAYPFAIAAFLGWLLVACYGVDNCLS
jgi:hypothetical protein